MTPLSVSAFKCALWFSRRPPPIRSLIRNGAAVSVAIELCHNRDHGQWWFSAYSGLLGTKFHVFDQDNAKFRSAFDRVLPLLPASSTTAAPPPPSPPTATPPSTAPSSSSASESTSCRSSSSGGSTSPDSGLASDDSQQSSPPRRDSFIPSIGSIIGSLKTTADDRNKFERSSNSVGSVSTRSRTPSSSSSSSASSTDLESDIKTVFAQASASYASRLTSIVAADMLTCHRPDEAMKCWSECDHSSRAFYNLGCAFESGLRTVDARPDLTRAYDCFAIGASMGHALSTYNLALFFLYGKGEVAQDTGLGLSLLATAARRGLYEARSILEEYASKSTAMKLIN